MKALKRKKYRPRDLKLPPLCAFDYETDGLGGEFIIGAYVTNDGQTELFYNLTDCFAYMLLHPEYRFLAHNASGYEFAYLYPLIVQFFETDPSISIKPILQGESRVIEIVIYKDDKKFLDIRDTLCLFDMTLEATAKAFCPDFPKLKEEGPDFASGEKFDPTNPGHIKYVIRDCEVIIAAYTRFAEQQKEVFGSPLGLTAGSTAMRAFMTTIPEGHAYYRANRKQEAFFRHTYYGGLVLPGHEIGDWGKVGGVDVNAAYAFQMGKNLFPVGTACYVDEYVPDYPGFYYVRASVPPSVFSNCGFNPLPKRGKTGVTYPTGDFTTHITHVEYEFALECGCEIEVLEGYVFFRQEPVFKGFVEKCQQMELAENGRFKPTIKKNRNCCYGKFGTKPFHTVLLYSHTTLMDGPIPVINTETGEEIPYLYTGLEETDSPYIMPHWASLVTAYQRIYMMSIVKEAYARGANNVYVDTDSLKLDYVVMLDLVEKGVIAVGKNYGQFKVEEVCDHFIVLGPKCYGGITVSDNLQCTWPPLTKAKGIPKSKLTMGLYTDAIRGIRKEVGFDSVKSVMNIIKTQSPVQPIRRKRRITDITNSNAWVVYEGRIYPHGYEVVQTT